MNHDTILVLVVVIAAVIAIVGAVIAGVSLNSIRAVIDYGSRANQRADAAVMRAQGAERTANAAMVKADDLVMAMGDHRVFDHAPPAPIVNAVAPEIPKPARKRAPRAAPATTTKKAAVKKAAAPRKATTR